MAHRGNPHSLPDAGSVVGRDAEVAEIEAFLTQTPPPAALVLAGPAGIGKTTLWQAGVSAAREADHRVVVSRPLESDATVSLAGLSDLLEEIVDEVTDELPGPQEQALNAALLREGDPRAPPDPRALNAAVRGVLHAAAAARPLLVAIDDLQWLDRPSMDALRHAMRRLDEDQVRLLVAERETPQSAAADLGLSLERVNRVEVGPLDLEEIRELIAGGWPPPASTRAAADRRALGGKSFYALVPAARATANPSRRRGSRKVKICSAWSGTACRTPSDRRDALGTVAALARPSSVVVSQVLGDEAALDPAFRAGVLAEDGELLRFAHPLLAAAAYAALPPRRRREAHDRLAVIVDDPEERARHLAAATVAPDAAVAAALDAGARAADSRGAPAAAGELLERAASLTPDDDRARPPAACSTLPKTTSALGMVAVGPSSPGALSTASARAPARGGPPYPGLERADREQCGRVGTPGRQGMRRRPRRAGRLPARRRPGHEGRRLVRRQGDRPGGPGHRANGQPARAEGGAGVRRRTRGIDDARRRPGDAAAALALETEPTSQLGWWDPAVDLGGAHMLTDELDQARELLESARQRATDAGDEDTAENVYRYLAQLEVRAGNLAPALAYAEEGMALVEHETASWTLSSQLFVRALVAAHQGDADMARELTARGISMTEELGDEVFAILHHCVLGFLELSLGNPGEALSHSSRCRPASSAWVSASHASLARFYPRRTD